MPFQSQVSALQAPGLSGAFASANPYASLDAGQGALTAGNAANTGLFHWIQSNGTIESTGPVPLTAPDGFLANEHQGLITAWLGQSTVNVPKGLGVTLYERGDFWDANLYAPAARSQKVFVNAYGQIAPGAAGAFLTTDASSVGTISSAHIDNGVTIGVAGNILTVVTGAGLVVGQILKDSVSGAVVGFITALGTGTGGAGTYTLNQNANYPSASTFTVVSTPVTGAAGATASFATNVMTVTIAATNGAFAVGQFIQSAGVAAGTYITSLGTGTGGTGTYNLSTSPGTIAAQASAGSGWVETPWSYKSNANAGDVAKIGVRN